MTKTCDQTPRNTLVLYHASCADGFGAAFAAWMHLGDQAEYKAVRYGETLSDASFDTLIRDRKVILLDFSFDRPRTMHLFKAASEVVWLDHHKTAFEMWCGLDYLLQQDRFEQQLDDQHYILLDNQKSGALLAWEYFQPKIPAPPLIRYIDDTDRWQFQMPNAREFIRSLWSYTPWSFSHWKKLLNPIDEERMVQEGKAIQRAHEQNTFSVMKGGQRSCQLRSGEQIALGLAANCPPHLTSDVGHLLAEQSGTFGLCWLQNKDGLVICSLRSTGEYDVSAIASWFGGGGHRNAAGFQTDMKTLQDWLSVADHKQTVE